MITEREINLLDTEAQRLLTMYQKEQHGALLNEVDELSKSGTLSPGVLGLASLALSALERYEEAAKAARGGLQQATGWAWLHHALAEAEALQGHREQALSVQRQAVQLMPGEPIYMAGLARRLREAGQAEQAVRTARQALVVSEAHAGVLSELGLALQETGDTAGALAAFRQAQAGAPAEANAHVHEGVLHLRAGARSEARHSLREALKREPGLTQAENHMAETLTGTQGFLRKAVLHTLDLGRVTLIGWSMIAFLYYVAFRLLEFVWKVWPAALPVGRALLVVSLVYLLGGMVLGHTLRLAFRTGWPR